MKPSWSCSLFSLSLCCFGAMATTSADAHCYSQWHYPWAQKCEPHEERNPIKNVREPSVKRDPKIDERTAEWRVEITKLPPVSDEEQNALDLREHDAAVAANKAELNWLLAHVHDPDSQYNQERMQEGKNHE